MTMRSPFGAVSALALLAGSAQADVIFTLGNHPQGNELNIFFEAPEASATAPDTIHGDVGQLLNEIVDFHSNGNPLDQDAQGQADILNDILPNKDTLTDLEITVPGFTFTDFIMNPLNGVGDATVTAIDNTNHVFNYDLGNGQNFLTITTANGESITELDISVACNGVPGCDASNVGFLEFKQPRISGVAPLAVSVPEPATSLGLLAAALAMLGFSVWRGRCAHKQHSSLWQA